MKYESFRVILKPGTRQFIELPVMFTTAIFGFIFSWHKLPFVPISNIIGILILLSGLYIHFVSHKYHKKAHKGLDNIDKIIDYGIYSKIRHPGYLGLIIFNIGFFISFGIIWLIVPVTVFSFLRIIDAVYEEKNLLEKFGKKYEDYEAKVKWRMIPNIF